MLKMYKELHLEIYNVYFVFKTSFSNYKCIFLNI